MKHGIKNGSNRTNKTSKTNKTGKAGKTGKADKTIKTAKREGKAIIISSVSGGGKTSLIALLTQRYPELFVAITATTRPARGEEKNGIHYYFYSQEQFEEKVSQKEFLEYALVHGHYYGVPAEPVLKALKAGRSAILNIDFQGMLAITRRLKEESVLSIFLMPPDGATWQERLQGRGTNSEEEIKRRLLEGQKEMKQAHLYDHIIVNDDLERATAEIEGYLWEKSIVKAPYAKNRQKPL